MGTHGTSLILWFIPQTPLQRQEHHPIPGWGRRAESVSAGSCPCQSSCKSQHAEEVKRKQQMHLPRLKCFPSASEGQHPIADPFLPAPKIHISACGLYKGHRASLPGQHTSPAWDEASSVGLELSHKVLSMTVQVPGSPAVVWWPRRLLGVTCSWCTSSAHLHGALCDIQLAQGHGGPGQCWWLTAP